MKRYTHSASFYKLLFSRPEIYFKIKSITFRSTITYMPKMKLVFYILLCVSCARAQNLIPDSSFEEHTSVPVDFSAINSSNTWNTPSLGTTDLFCVCDRKQKKYSMVDVPQNPMGFQSPHSGTCYAGFFALSHENYREYIQTPLIKPLEKGKSYLFSVYISLADYSRTYIDQLGVCFLPQKVKYNSSNVIKDLNPVYMQIGNEVGKDIENWHHVTVIYTANGTETYLLFGSFAMHQIKKTKYKAPRGIKSRINQTSERDAYYFMDDVSLVETTALIEHEQAAIVKTELDTLNNLPADTALVLKNILFKTNKAKLVPSSYADLDKLSNYLKNNVLLKIGVFGHSDNVGSEKTNQKLSAERAKAVADYLIKQHIDWKRITIVGYGSTKPLVQNDTPEHKQQNRRVEFILLKD